MTNTDLPKSAPTPEKDSVDDAVRGSRWLPALKSRWWSVVLGVSLMLNLLVGGVILGHSFGPGTVERFAGASQVQLIPRKFFHDLSGPRRKELTGLVKSRTAEFRDLRSASREAGIKLADVLDREPFSIDEVKLTVAEFATGAHSLAASGGAAVVDIIGQLTPEERKLLANAIRERGARGKGSKN